MILWEALPSTTVHVSEKYFGMCKEENLKQLDTQYRHVLQIANLFVEHRKTIKQDNHHQINMKFSEGYETSVHVHVNFLLSLTMKSILNELDE